MRTYKLLGLAIAAAALLAAGPVAAQDYADDYDQSQDQSAPDDSNTVDQQDVVDHDDAPDSTDSIDDTALEDQPIDAPDNMAEPADLAEPYQEPAPIIGGDQDAGMTPMGVSLTIGGGANGFTDGDFNDFVDVGGGWEGRLAIGTRSWVGVEASYVGTANNFKALDGVDQDAKLLANGVNGALRFNLAPTALRPYLLAGAGWKHYSVENTDTNTSDIRDSDNVVEFPLGGGVSYTYNRFIADVRGTFTPAIDEELFRSEVGNNDTKLHTWKATANVGFEF